jgi:hypothetical protein
MERQPARKVSEWCYLSMEAVKAIKCITDCGYQNRTPPMLQQSSLHPIG